MENYPYQLVKFFTKNKKGEAEVDCVPSTWITFNINSGQCESIYPPPPYNSDTFQLLHDLVTKRAPPPESWPSFAITLQGHAKDYDQAIERLQILKAKEHAYTSDENMSKAKKAAASIKSYETKVIKSNDKVTKRILEVPRIRTSNSSESTTSPNASLEDCDISSKEYTDVNENDCTTQNSNKKNKNNVKKNQNKKDNLEFPNNQDYMTEVPGKPCSSRKKASLMTATQPSASQEVHVLGTKKKPLASLDKRSGFFGTSGNSTRSHTSVSSINSPSSVNRNSNELRTHSPSKSPAASSKETKRSLESAIEGLRYDIQAMTREFVQLKEIVQNSALAQDKFSVNVQSFSSEYEVSLPIKTMAQFKAFDHRLEQEQKFCKDFTATLHFMIDPRTTLSRNITGILKKHLTRDLALMFTAVEASKDKSIFKDTSFCKCMIEVTRLKCKTIEKDVTMPITDKFYYRQLGNALSNASDWDGNRKQRLRRKPAAQSSAQNLTEAENEVENND